MTTDLTGLRELFPDSWRWLRIARHIGGWLTDAEGNAIFHLAHSLPQENLVIVELGSWQGKSSVLLGAAVAGKGNPRVYCIDPFGQDENPEYQAEFYDSLLSRLGRSLKDTFERNIRRCGLQQIIRPIQAYSFDAVANWQEPIDLLFVDASHDYEAVHRDVMLWAPFVKPGGIVALHDVSANWPGPSRVMAEDVQPPYFADPQLVDSLFWATKTSDGALPERASTTVTIPKADFDARQREIAQLSKDRQYLKDELARVSTDQERIKKMAIGESVARQMLAAELEGTAARLNARIQTMAAAESALTAKNDALSREIGRLHHEKELLAESLRRTQAAHASANDDLQRALIQSREAEHANRSLRQSWSWRISAPLRFVVDLAGLLRRGGSPLGAFSRFRSAVQWLVFRKAIQESRLFDSGYYLEQNPDLRSRHMNLLLHYFLYGSAEGRQPHPLFDSAYYLTENPDVAASGVNPLAHYLKWGAFEGRNPHPLFDSSFYLRENPDVGERHWNPLAHYLGPGTPEGRDPNPEFHTAAYLNEHPEVAVAAINPLVHFLRRQEVLSER